jgi:hypothetical protein
VGLKDAGDTADARQQKALLPLFTFRTRYVRLESEVRAEANGRE